MTYIWDLVEHLNKTAQDCTCLGACWDAIVGDNAGMSVWGGSYGVLGWETGFVGFWIEVFPIDILSRGSSAGTGTLLACKVMK